MNVLRRQSGVTLVETLLAAAILVIVATTMLSVLLVAEASGRTMLTDVDANQQLRAAMRQITEDLTYATKRQVACDATGSTLGYVGCTMVVAGHMPQVDGGTGDGWPGALLNAAPYPPPDDDLHIVLIRYKLAGDVLIRELVHDDDATRIYATQVLATGLLPYDPGQTGSYFDPAGSQLVTVVLRMPKLNARGEAREAAGLSAKFFLP